MKPRKRLTYVHKIPKSGSKRRIRVNYCELKKALSLDGNSIKKIFPAIFYECKTFDERNLKSCLHFVVFQVHKVNGKIDTF